MKYCVYKSCKNNNRPKKPGLISVKFFEVPKPTTNIERCATWVKAINRPNITCQSIAKHHYVCSVHFVGGDGPTQNNPDPIPDCEEILSKDISIRELDSSQSSEQSKSESIQCAPGSPIAVFKPPLLDYSRKLLVCSKSTNVQDIQTSASQSSELSEVEVSPGILKCAVSPSTDMCKSTQEVVHEKTLELSLSPIRSTRCTDTATSPFMCTEKTLLSLETLAREFLVYHAYNLHSLFWFLHPTNEAFGQTRTQLSFKKLCGLSFLNIEVSSDMEVSVWPCNKQLSRSHIIYSDLEKPLTSLEDLLCTMRKIDDFSVCEGIRGDLFDFFQNVGLVSSFVGYSTQSIRSRKCEFLFNKKTSSICCSCRLMKQVLQKRAKRMKNLQSGSSKSINVRFMDKLQLKQRSTALSLKNRAPKTKVNVLENKIKRSLHKDGIFMSEEDSVEFEEIL